MGIILSIVVGALISWFITHSYYKKSAVDQQKISSKLSDEVKETILNSSAEKLSIKDLNKLLEDKIYDKDAKGDPLPYKACPECGSHELVASSAIDHEHYEQYFFIKCENCGWNSWSQ